MAARCSQCADSAPWRVRRRNQILADLAADMDKFLRSTFFERTTISPAPRFAGGFYDARYLSREAKATVIDVRCVADRAYSISRV